MRVNDASASIVSGTTRSPDDESSGGKFSKQNQKGILATAAMPDGPNLHHANLIGRGIANCKNEQGFQFNLPARLAISLNADKELPLQSLRASMEPISVDRDVNMIFDNYAPHVELRNTPASGSYSSPERAIVVKGLKNDVLMQINLNIPAEFTSKVNIASVDLKFDRDSTPSPERK